MSVSLGHIRAPKLTEHKVQKRALEGYGEDVVLIWF